MVLQVVPPLFFCLFLFSLSEAENPSSTSINGTDAGCVSADRADWSKVHTDAEVCTPYQTLFPNGYCKDILGYQPIYGKDRKELKHNEEKMIEFRTFLLKRSGGNLTDGVQITFFHRSFVLRRSCLDMVDDVYCHHYFKRCYILSSTPPLVCRETCEELFYKECDLTKETMMLLRSNFDFIQCETLPFRNESSSCYYPNKTRDELNLLESEDCFFGDGRGYRGNRSVTKSGYTCQSWNAQCPHRHNISGTIYKEISGNLCRNPGGHALEGPWCFTTNRTVRWEYCDVPRCADQPPLSPPVNFRGRNTSSRSIKLTWGDVPNKRIYGVLGFHVECERVGNMSDRHFNDIAVHAKHEWAFKGLQKYRKYSCRLRAYNKFGNGTWSGGLTISTDEDAPDRPPTDITVHSLGSDVIQVSWNPVPSERTNGKLLGYNVFHNEIDALSPVNITVALAEETHVDINGLKPNTNYSFQVLAFTAKGSGPKSKTYFAKTLSDQSDLTQTPGLGSGKSQTAKVGTVVAGVLSGTVALGVVVLVIYFVRKRRMQSRVNKDNDFNDILAPKASSSSDGVEKMDSAANQGYDMSDDTVPTTDYQPRYIFNTADESLFLSEK